MEYIKQELENIKENGRSFLGIDGGDITSKIWFCGIEFGGKLEDMIDYYKSPTVQFNSIKEFDLPIPFREDTGGFENSTYDRFLSAMYINLFKNEKLHNGNDTKPIENPIYPKAKVIIDKYSDSAERLIENKLMPKMGNPTMNKWLKVVAKKAGIKQNLYHHMARHTCATTILLENGVSLEMVKEFLGHKNISSTMIYARVTNSSKIRSMERLLRVLNV